MTVFIKKNPCIYQAAEGEPGEKEALVKQMRPLYLELFNLRAEMVALEDGEGAFSGIPSKANQILELRLLADGRLERRPEIAVIRENQFDDSEAEILTRDVDVMLRTPRKSDGYAKEIWRAGQDEPAFAEEGDELHKEYDEEALGAHHTVLHIDGGKLCAHLPIPESILRPIWNRVATEAIHSAHLHVQAYMFFNHGRADCWMERESLVPGRATFLSVTSPPKLTSSNEANLHGEREGPNDAQVSTGVDAARSEGHADLLRGLNRLTLSVNLLAVSVLIAGVVSVAS